MTTMELNELLWLQNLVPLAYQGFKSLKDLEDKDLQVKQKRRQLSPAPLPEPKPEHITSASKRKRKTLQTATTTNRKIWVKEENMNRDKEGLFATTFENIYLHNHDEFKARTCMTPQVFDMVFCLVSEQLIKNSIRTPIAPVCRLFLTLSYLAKAESISDLAQSFKMGPSTVRTIIQDTCDILWTTLEPMFLAQPSAHDWKNIADSYQQIWHIPHCLGAVDTRLLNITYKGDKNIALLACCDTNLAFTSIDIAQVNKAGGGPLNWYLDFATQLCNHNLEGLLPAQPLSQSSNESLPYAFISPTSFPMRDNIISCYESTKLDVKQINFNEHLSSILEQSIGKTFDILFSRWRVLSQPLALSPNNAYKIVRATVALHNFVRMHDESYGDDAYMAQMSACEKITKEPSPCLRKVQSVPKNINVWKLRDSIKEQLMEHNHAELSDFEALVQSVVE